MTYQIVKNKIMKVIYMNNTIAMMYNKNPKETMEFLTKCKLKQIEGLQYAVFNQ